LQGDPAEILASPIYQPVGQLFYNSLGRGGGLFYTVAAFIILQFVCFTAMVSPKQLSFPYATASPLRDWTLLAPERVANAPRRSLNSDHDPLYFVRFLSEWRVGLP
jgi:hypothetical protein